MSCACRRPSCPTRPGRKTWRRRWPSAATRWRTTARVAGTGGRCCPGSGSTTSCAGCRTSPASRPPTPRPRPARSPRPAAGCASPRSTCPTVAARRTRTTRTSWSGWAALAAAVDTPATAVVAGDMNIAPTDGDLWDPALFVDSTHVTPAERAALGKLVGLGLADVVRDRWPSERIFTYWDYRAGRFHQDKGMRIDLVLAGRDPAGRVAAAWVDRKARKGSGPSDHAPVIVDLDEAPDGDIGPVVPPASNPVR